MTTSTTPARPSPDPPLPRPATRPAPTRGRGGRPPAAVGVAIVLVAQLMLVLDATVVNVALPHIQSDLGFSPAGLSWVLNAYTLAFGGLLLLGGRLGDVLGRLRTFELGLGRLHRRQPARGPRDLPGVAHRRAHPPGGRRRARRTGRPRAADDERAERGRPQPGARPVHRRVLGRCVHRPAPRWGAHRPRQLALDPLRQRADRRGRPRPRPALRLRDPSRARPLRRRRGRHGDRRLGRGRPRLHQRCRPGMDLARDPPVLRARALLSASSSAPRAASPRRCCRWASCATAAVPVRSSSWPSSSARSSRRSSS